MEAERKRNEYFANLGAGRRQPTIPPQKTNGAATVVPFSVAAARVPGGMLSQAVPTGLVEAALHADEAANTEPAAAHHSEPVAIGLATNPLGNTAASIEFVQEPAVMHVAPAPQQSEPPAANAGQEAGTAAPAPHLDFRMIFCAMWRHLGTI